jgi:hypothetical protein
VLTVYEYDDSKGTRLSLSLSLSVSVCLSLSLSVTAESRLRTCVDPPYQHRSGKMCSH